MRSQSSRTRSRGRSIAAAYALLTALALDACDGSEGDADAAAARGCEPGDRTACSCGGDRSGFALCDEGGALQACDCSVARTFPCSAPGVAFACRCADGALGEQICLRDGRYTDCACEGGDSEPGALDAGGDVEPSTPPVLDEPSACPSPFVCVEQMGYQVCADDTGVPPLCAAASDCASAGLPDAACLDPGVGGEIMLCVQACAL